MNDAHPQQHAKEEITATPTLFAAKSFENDRKASWDPKVSLSSRPDEDQSDPGLERQFNRLDFHGHNTIMSAIEKSFKDEEYISVSIFSPSVWTSKSIFIIG